VRDRDGVVGSQEYGGRAFVPKRSITAEQTRRLIEEHFATIARRSTPQNLIKESCGTGPGASPTNGVVLFRYGPTRGNRRWIAFGAARGRVARHITHQQNRATRASFGVSRVSDRLTGRLVARLAV
jgi:hypothetical protein